MRDLAEKVFVLVMGSVILGFVFVKVVHPLYTTFNTALAF